MDAAVREEGSRYAYRYSLFNSTIDSIGIQFLTIDLRDEPSEHPLSTVDVSASHSFKDHFEVIDRAKHLRPVKVTIPHQWTSNSAGTWATADTSRSTLLQPGESLDDFGLLASQPPGIRDFLVGGYDDDFPNNPGDYNWEEEFKGSTIAPAELLSLAVDRGIEHIGRTIAPVEPPSRFTVISWTAYMSGYASEARRQGWVNSEPQLNKVNSLIQHLEVHDLGALKKSVVAISAYVSAELAAGRMTSEADALIRLNAEYLLRRAEQDPNILKAK